MDCRSCGVVNAPGRRYCRECGLRLGRPCIVCHFFNSLEDKHCGGCGRSLRSADETDERAAACAPVLTDDMGLGEEDAAPAGAEAGMAGAGVSQSEIDGLFDNILDGEAGGGRGAGE